ncbi:hypothetical protein BGZ80_002399 [Entomortierella chlamydospora]|uniref:Uncharacterized protein n=1 Tax=Entomortierella chlamydospora TaxID=101097 RepID=A0A9P6N2J7_9FUNG|nr:hypothetical protein BGZ79_006850 [Entomortierella chlamydospora]KAG0021431.1 hypothetical protein BGZ80_002399 [Entomortierella chlamydospora]
MYKFTDVKRENDTNAFYYSESDVKKSRVEIDYNGCLLTEQQLRSYFGIDNSKMMELPEILIVPIFNSTSKNAKKDSWYSITGHVVVYKPLAWVPKVTLLNTIPRSKITTRTEIKPTKIEPSKLYTNLGTDFTLSIRGGWKGVRTKSTNVKANADNMASERVYERYVTLSLSDEMDMTWGGIDKWDDIKVKKSDLRYVNHLQFHPIAMSGSGHVNSLYLQVLPGFNEQKMLTNLHIIFSCESWANWFAYKGESREVEEYRDEVLAMPESHPPLVTFIPVELNCEPRSTA